MDRFHYMNAAVGSSPHTRGARLWASTLLRLIRDHPRIRGEHQAQRDMFNDLAGIIPAYAGSTAFLKSEKFLT